MAELGGAEQIARDIDNGKITAIYLAPSPDKPRGVVFSERFQARAGARAQGNRRAFRDPGRVFVEPSGHVIERHSVSARRLGLV
jgi:hypothetical protein